MKKFTAALLIALFAAASTACTSETSYGECVGLMEEKDPTLKYEYDVGNVVLGVIFLETIFVPLIVGLDELQCPTGAKQTADARVPNVTAGPLTAVTDAGAAL